MKIIIDVMSGDNAPLELLKGAIMAAQEYSASIVVVGDREVIEKTAEEEGLSLDKITVVHADSVINMEDKALSVVREKKDSSMSIGLKMLSQGEGDAFVSAGNTGALLAGATLLVRRIKGIQRAAIATVLPFSSPMMLIDCGANLEISPENAEQFAIMGSIYMEKIYGIKNPRVGQVNNGTEYNKGLPLQVKAYELMSNSKDINFVGNIEAKNIPFSECEVLVTDGFTGNVVLKLLEGMGKFMFTELKSMFFSNVATKISAAFMKSQLKGLKAKFDASEHGGAPLLGISMPVIKAHGSSDAKAIKNAVHQAITFVNTGINRDIAKWVLDKEAEKKETEKVENTENNY
jgi:glycerol-3-phosphate acyltransferase PlsX